MLYLEMKFGLFSLTLYKSSTARTMKVIKETWLFVATWILGNLQQILAKHNIYIYI